MVANKKRKQERLGSDGAFFSVDQNVQVRLLGAVPIDQLEISDLNPRFHRDEGRIREIAELIALHGFDPAYALKVYPVGDGYHVFAGGNRLLAARQAGIPTVPVYVYDGLSPNEIWQLAYRDNEQAGKHSRVNPVDVWRDYAKRITEEKWSQADMAKWLGVSQAAISIRVRLSQAEVLHRPTLDGKLDEGHCQEILGVYQTSNKLAPWLTTEDAQSELVEEVLSKHRGQHLKPTVKVVREAAKRWKTLIQAAEDAYKSLPGGQWGDKFVEILASDKVRTEAAVNRALSRVVRMRRQQEEQAVAELRGEADEKEREAQRLKREETKLSFLESQTQKLRMGDARDLMVEAPAGFHLLLTDPPYGIGFRSNRAVSTAKKDKIAGDNKEEALALLTDVLGKAFSRMADHSTCLVFTGWRHEPEFRQVVEAAGFTIKGSLIWVRNNHGTGDLAGSFAPKHERIIHAIKGNPKLQRRAPDVLFGQDKPVTDHPTEKPRDLLLQLIEATTGPGDCVVDPFAGSGNALLEAYRTGRDFFGIELEPRWHQVAVDVIYKMAEQEFSDGSLGK